MLTLTYAVLAVLGCGYVLLAAFLGHVGDSFDAGHADGDGGGMGDAHGDGGDGGAYGIDSSGHASSSAGDGAGASFAFPFFSPLAIATMFGAIGAYGLITKVGLQVGDIPSLAISVPASIVTAYVVTYLAWRLVVSSTGSSQIKNRDLIGADAEVLTPIPAGGVGEVAAMVNGQRFTSSARDEAGGTIARGTHVTVVKVIGATMVVRAAGARPQGGSNELD